MNSESSVANAQPDLEGLPQRSRRSFRLGRGGGLGQCSALNLMGISIKFPVFSGPRQLQGSQNLTFQSIVLSRLSSISFTFPRPFLSSPYGPADLSWRLDTVFGQPMVGEQDQPETTPTVWGSKHDTFLDSPLCSVHNSKLSPPPNSTSHSKFHFGSHSGRADSHL